MDDIGPLNSDALWQLAYVSTSTHIMTRNDLMSLLHECRTFNQKHNITGLLLYRDERFMQVIEGPEKDLHLLYQKIGNDPRHTDLQLLWDNEYDQRDYPTWWMAYENLSQEQVKDDAFLSLQSDKLHQLLQNIIADRDKMKFEIDSFIKDFTQGYNFNY